MTYRGRERARHPDYLTAGAICPAAMALFEVDPNHTRYDSPQA